MSHPPDRACTTCGACCRSHIIPVCGYDVWRISTRQGLSPEQFLVAWGQVEPGRDGFRLDAGGKLYGLALDKQGPFEARQRCVFLLRLADGEDRCGIYAERPDVCRVYPMASWRGVLYKRADSACPPGSWSPATIRGLPWRDSFDNLHMHFDIYHEVVARWNARIAAYPGQHFALSEYFSYLLNVYDSLAGLEAETGEEALAAIRAGWPRVPRFGQEGPAAGDRRWLAYLEQARARIDRFYPEIPPLPLMALIPAHVAVTLSAAATGSGA